MATGQISLSRAELETRSFVARVYRWMTVGLALTAFVCWYLSLTPAVIVNLMSKPFLFFGLMILELGAVFVLSGLVRRMASATAVLIFSGYAVLNGITLSSIFLVYTQSSIANAFFVTAGTFAVMSLWGSTTKTDLTSFGNVLFMALIGLVLATFANMFFRSAKLDWITTYAGILIFTGLTAYDAQKIKAMAGGAFANEDEETKDAISAALMLYLDFVNLFLDLLRVMGQRRED